LLFHVGDAKKVFKSNTEAHDTKPQQNWGQEDVYLPDSSLPVSFIHPHRHEKSVFTADTALLTPTYYFLGNLAPKNRKTTTPPE
jgi:hypothetical protein